MISADANAATYFVDRHIAQDHGAAEAYLEIETGRSLTYDGLATGAAQVAGAFARAGIRAEERVGLLVLDRIPTIVLWCT